MEDLICQPKKFTLHQASNEELPKVFRQDVFSLRGAAQESVMPYISPIADWINKQMLCVYVFT